MEIMFLLIGISLLMAGGFLAAFFWAIRSGQYEDMETPAWRILFEDNVLIKPANCDSKGEEPETPLSSVTKKDTTGNK